VSTRTAVRSGRCGIQSFPTTGGISSSTLTPDVLVHPAANLFPMLDREEFDRLVESVRTRGLEHPIVLDDKGTLLDGRNRMRACAIAGVSPRFETYGGDDPVDYIVRVNVHRRHLTTSQRAMLGLRLLPHYEEEAKKRMAAAGASAAPRRPAQKARAERPTLSIGRARDAAASAIGTSGRSIARAKRLMEQAPDLAEKVWSGQLPLDRAERLLREATPAKREAGLPVVQSEDWGTERVRLLHGDFRDRLAELEPGAVDVLITDPPYDKESLPLYGDLARWAQKLLGPRGILLVSTGQLFLPQVLELLGAHMNYGWAFALELTGSRARVPARHIVQEWKPIVAFTPGPWPSGGRWYAHGDLLVSHEREKELYEWQHPVAPVRLLIERYCPEDGLVVDPFMGVGSFGVAALSSGRRFVGVETHLGRFEQARQRLLEYCSGMRC
jgi:hypothetical protein